ncbi:MAG: hypothetical protein KDB27_08410 [Planctomycetales bacterium]|nr:hypothetical protein [Planctomycetales bacterium]
MEIKNRQPAFCVFALIAAILPLFAVCYAHGGELQQFTLRHDGRNRRFVVYVPDGYTAETAWPLVINMHGATSNSTQQRSISRMNPVADAENFLVAYPEAVGGFWNDTLSPSRPDDIGFIGAMVDQVNADFEVDSSRVYATGFSQGGSMSYLLANALPDRIAAIASVSGSPGIRDDDGSLPVDLTRAPTSTRAVPILYFVGTADTEQFAGGRIPVNGIVVPPFSDIMEAWAVNNGCELELATTELSDLVVDDGPTTVTRNEFIACGTYRASNGDDVVAEVSYFLIADGGHAWPGGAAGGDGNQNQDINASEEIWNFFSRHSLPVDLHVQPVFGDFDGDGQLTATDIDSLSKEIFAAEPRTSFDLNGDGLVKNEDRIAWVKELKNTYFGDANLDNEFNSGDMVAIFTVGKYETGQPAGWAEGDWTGDGLFDSGDLVAAFQDGGYEQGLRIETIAVPESHGCFCLAIGLLLTVPHLRTRSALGFHAG